MKNRKNYCFCRNIFLLCLVRDHWAEITCMENSQSYSRLPDVTSKLVGVLQDVDSNDDAQEQNGGQDVAVRDEFIVERWFSIKFVNSRSRASLNDFSSNRFVCTTRFEMPSFTHWEVRKKLLANFFVRRFDFVFFQSAVLSKRIYNFCTKIMKILRFFRRSSSFLVSERWDDYWT